jgi:hypothetical protein
VRWRGRRPGGGDLEIEIDRDDSSCVAWHSATVLVVLHQLDCSSPVASLASLGDIVGPCVPSEQMLPKAGNCDVSHLFSTHTRRAGRSTFRMRRTQHVTRRNPPFIGVSLRLLRPVSDEVVPKASEAGAESGWKHWQLIYETNLLATRQLSANNLKPHYKPKHWVATSILVSLEVTASRMRQIVQFTQPDPRGAPPATRP